MTPAELQQLEADLMAGRAPSAAVVKPALGWTAAEMRAAEQRLYAGRPVAA